MPEEQQNWQTKYSPYFIPAAILIAGIMIASSILYTGGAFQGLPTTETKEDTGKTLGGQPSVQQPGSAGKTDIEVSQNDHIRGNPSAQVTIIEFSDLQCPFCKRFHPTAQQALAEYGNKIRWVYKHFPLDAIHPEARPAAEASECVWEQKGNDGFWQFVDGVFENQDRIGAALYRELAQQIGVNMAQFENCVSSRKYQQKVEDDYNAGVAAEVRGTPGNFVNGEPIPGAVPYEILKAAIDRALQGR